MNDRKPILIEEVDEVFEYTDPPGGMPLPQQAPPPPSTPQLPVPPLAGDSQERADM